MSSWMVRGLVYAAAMTVVRLIQGALINAWQTQAGLISIVLLVLFTIGVVVWGVVDGRADARANPDPDRRRDLAMTWLLAGLLAGILSGAVCWLISLFYKGLYTGGLLNEITTFAAFTALLVFLPGIIGVTIGRRRIDRKPEAQQRRAEVDEERANTDVFSAVRGDDAPTGEIPTRAGGAEHEEQTAAVATAERGAEHEPAHEREARTETIPKTEDRTEAIPTSEARTDSIPTRDDDAKTEVIRKDTGSRHGRPEPEQD